MVATIVLVVSLNVMHPPAVGIALSFAFRGGLAVGLVVMLVLQRGSAYLLNCLSSTPAPTAAV